MAKVSNAVEILPKIATAWALHTIIKQNWNQFLLVVKATALKQQISNLYPQIQRTDASDHICASHRPAVNVKASFCTDNAFCLFCFFIICAVLLGKIKGVG